MTKMFRGDAPKIHGDGRAWRSTDSRRGYFLPAGKRRAGRADNRASETVRSLVRSLPRSRTQVNSGWRLTSRRAGEAERVHEVADRSDSARHEDEREGGAGGREKRDGAFYFIRVAKENEKREKERDKRTYPINQSTVSRRYSGNLSSLDDFRVDHRREESSARDRRENKV